MATTVRDRGASRAALAARDQPPSEPTRRLAATLALGPAGIDVVSMAACTVVVGQFAGPALGIAATATQTAVAAGLAGMLAVVLNAAGGLYRTRLLPSSLDGGLCLFCSGLVAPVIATSAATNTAVRAGAAVIGLAHCLVAVSSRAALCTAVSRARRRGRTVPTLVVGAGDHGRRLAAAMLRHPEYGLRPAGFTDRREPIDRLGPTSADRPGPARGDRLEQASGGLGPASGDRLGPVPGGLGPASGDRPVPGVTVLGRPDELRELVRAHRIGAVVITVPYDRDSQVLARAARAIGCEVYLAPEADDVVADFVPKGEHLRSFPILRMRPIPQARPTWPLKRALDVALSALGLLVCWPVLAVCALAMRWESGPGVLFRQRRVGGGGRDVEVLKLRTLTPADEHESATRWTIADDLRLRPGGRLLRTLSVDELPQLWNVLKGDMSIVGPRPERPYFADRFARTIPDYDRRHRVPVGMTGWAQIHGLRGDTSIEDRARFDNHYIDDWSLGGDLKIILRTAWCLIRLGGD
jgi:lipopolysaccharide/colanic/teichoic acid biosynthesis glycosyltransferase